MRKLTVSTPWIFFVFAFAPVSALAEPGGWINDQASMDLVPDNSEIEILKDISLPGNTKAITFYYNDKNQAAVYNGFAADSKDLGPETSKRYCEFNLLEATNDARVLNGRVPDGKGGETVVRSLVVTAAKRIADDDSSRKKPKRDYLSLEFANDPAISHAFCNFVPTVGDLRELMQWKTWMRYPQGVKDEGPKEAYFLPPWIDDTRQILVTLNPEERLKKRPVSERGPKSPAGEDSPSRARSAVSPKAAI